MPLPLTVSCSSTSRLVLPFWCRLTWVVPDNIQQGCKTVLRACACVCVCMLCCYVNAFSALMLLIGQHLAQINLDWFYFPGFTFLVPAHPGSPRQNPENHETVIAVVVIAK